MRGVAGCQPGHVGRHHQRCVAACRRWAVPGLHPQTQGARRDRAQFRELFRVDEARRDRPCGPGATPGACPDGVFAAPQVARPASGGQAVRGGARGCARPHAGPAGGVSALRQGARATTGTGARRASAGGGRKRWSVCRWQAGQCTASWCSLSAGLSVPARSPEVHNVVQGAIFPCTNAVPRATVGVAMTSANSSSTDQALVLRCRRSHCMHRSVAAEAVRPLTAVNRRPAHTSANASANTSANRAVSLSRPTPAAGGPPLPGRGGGGYTGLQICSTSRQGLNPWICSTRTPRSSSPT
jgi:hypothetical protein